MRRPTVIIGSIVGVVLAVMWVVALQGPHPTEEIALDYGVSEIQPLAGFVDAPNELSPSQVGVIVWVALFGLTGILAAVHRFMISAVRRPEDRRSVAADGGALTVPAPTWMLSGDRHVVEYYDASDDVAGLDAVSEPYAAVVACDMPLVEPTVLADLFERAAGVDAAIPKHADGQLQPVQAVYRTSAMRAAIGRMDSRGGSVHGALESLAVATVPVESFPERSFHNVNTRRDLAAAEHRFDGENSGGEIRLE